MARLPVSPTEHLSRVGVEPQEADGRAHQGRAEDGQLSRPRKVEHVEIGGDIHPPEEIGEHRERRCGNSGQPGGQPVKSIGQVDRVAAAGDDQGDKHHEEPGREVDHQIFEEGERGRGRGDGIGGHNRVEGQKEPEQQAEGALAGQLPPGDQAPDFPCTILR
jgi:hypothetical protein